MTACVLCTDAGGDLLWEDSLCRVVLVGDPHYPGFCRVILKAHVKEMTDLPTPVRSHLMAVVFGVEKVLRDLLSPDKINLASFGNMVPHVHWHVIPRFKEDRHFPEPLWGQVQREKAHAVPVDSAALKAAINSALAVVAKGG